MPGAEKRIRLQLRRKDMDVLGHLNHSVYHELFFEARSALMESIRTDTERFVLARSEVDYLQEVRYEDRHVDATVRVDEIGRSSVTLSQELLLRDGTPAARSRLVVVAWNVVERRSRELTPGERAALLRGGFNDGKPAPPSGEPHGAGRARRNEAHRDPERRRR
jgi:acyl-CoA thioester hydrolase